MEHYPEEEGPGRSLQEQRREQATFVRRGWDNKFGKDNMWIRVLQKAGGSKDNVTQNGSKT